MYRVKTIQSSDAIGQIVRGGRRYRSRSLVAIVAPVDGGDVDGAGVTSGCVAYVAPKRLGNAVLRNRCKRVLRAGLQMVLAEEYTQEALLSNDIILMANKGTIEAGAGDISRELADIFPKIVQAKN